jgi:hypothetical protein
MTAAGLTAEEIRMMTITNPERLLNDSDRTYDGETLTASEKK